MMIVIYNWLLICYNSNSRIRWVKHMRILDVDEISVEKEKIKKLEDIRKNILLSTALAGGLVWKEKVYSFYSVIARELLDLFDSELLGDIQLCKCNVNFKRIYIKDKSIMYNQTNLFLNSVVKLDINSWLNQALLYIDNKTLPSFLTTSEKEQLFSKLDTSEIQLVNQHYNRQELNGDKYFLKNNTENVELLNILDKAGYFNMTIYEYMKIVATGDYDYHVKEIANKNFKITYNQYILEIGAYLSKEIEKNQINLRKEYR